VRTQKEVKRVLVEEIGIPEQNIKVCAKTGLVVDIWGEMEQVAENASDGKINTIALRADMDALPIPENNPHL
jgi:hippurate hydrolase